MADDFDSDDDTCSLLVPVNIVNTPGVLKSVTAGEGTFSRASVGTYYDSNGVLQTAAVNVKRVTYNPANLMQEPYDLIESASTNLARYSESFDNGVWGKAGATSVPDAAASPRGDATADKIVESTANSAHYFDQTISIDASKTYTRSLFVKPAEKSLVRLEFYSVPTTSLRANVSFDMVSGAFFGESTSAGIAQSYSSEKLPNGWWRLKQTVTLGSTDTSCYFRVCLIASNGASVYAGDGISGIYLWGAQLEEGIKATSYFPTTNASATRAADVIGPAPALAEDTNPEWASGTTYTTGQVVHLASTHRVYESTGATGNAGKNPAVIANQFNAAGVATYWIDIGPTNRTAMFDGLINSQTSATSPLAITLTPGAFNGFALFGIDADTYEVVVKDEPGGNIIYSEPVTALEGSMPADYYEYFFDRFKPLTQFIRSGIEPYGSAEVTFTLRKATGQVKLGMLAIGDMKPVGIPQRDAVVSPGTFTYFKQDAYGYATIKKRPNATSMQIPCITDIENANQIKADIDSVSATPCVVIGSEAPLYEWMTTFGLVTADISPVPYPHVTVKLSVKGFI